MWLQTALTVVTVALGGLRVGGVKTAAFQAVAHVWVGGLVAAWLVGLAVRYSFVPAERRGPDAPYPTTLSEFFGVLQTHVLNCTLVCGWLALFVSLLELACAAFALTHGGPDA